MSPGEILRALALAIRDAVTPHVGEGHSSVLARCEERSIDHPETEAIISVRVGDWHTSASVTLTGHDEERAARECIDALRAKLTRRAGQLQAQLAATRAALGVLP